MAPSLLIGLDLVDGLVFKMSLDLPLAMLR
jgi:hypothetical protein